MHWPSEVHDNNICCRSVHGCPATICRVCADGVTRVKVWFYIALYPVHWTAQSALHFPPLADLFIPTPFSASLGSILAMQQLRNDYSLTFPPLSIARYSFIQLSRLRRREVKENAQTSKRYQRGFEPGLSRLRVRHSTTEPPRSTKKKVWFYIALYPVHWTAQSALHFPPLADLFIPTPFSASLGSILAMQQLRNDYSLTFPPLSIARYSFIQLSRLRRREVKENAQTSKR